MGQFVDLTNQQFNTLIADEYIGQGKWRCHCVNCGSLFIKTSNSVKKYGCKNCLKNHVDDTYFSNIDTANKAYIFGLLWADGTHSIDFHKIKLDLQNCDIDILQKIKTELQWTGNITSYVAKKGQSYRSEESIVNRIAIVSKQLSTDLQNKGFVSHRETAHLPFEYIPEPFIIDFIRGYFDGNGSISITQKINKSGKSRFCYLVTICGGTNLVQDIGNWLTTKYGIEYGYYQRKPENPHNITLVLKKRIHMLSFLNAIYNNPNSLHLNRKYNKYLNFLSYIKNV